MTEKLTIGNLGENTASKHLENKGYKILARNWHFDHKEIDIIAQKDNMLVIVEVKTREVNSASLPIDAVTIKKQRLLIDAAEAFLLRNNLDMEIRFDIISAFHHQGNIVKIEHLKNAFFAEL